MAKTPVVVWADAPAERDYPAASASLRLIAKSPTEEALPALLGQAPTVVQAVGEE